MRQSGLGQGQGGPSFKRVINYLCVLGGGGEAGRGCTVCEPVKCTQPGPGKVVWKRSGQGRPQPGPRAGVVSERPGMWPGAGARVVWGEI